MKESGKTLLVLVMLLVCVFLPSFAAVPFSPQDSSLVIKDVLIQTSAAYLWLSSIIHVITILLLIALYLYGSKIGRVADVFFGILFLFFAFSNHIAVTEHYGLAVITGNLVPILWWVCSGCGKSTNPITSILLRGSPVRDTRFCPSFS
jgi:hypothetical protein